MDSSSKASPREILQPVTRLFNASTKDEATLKSLAWLASFYERPIAQETFVAYLSVLQELTTSELQVAFSQAARQCKFFPPPAELRALAGCPTAAQLSEKAAHVALQWLIDLVRRHGCDLRSVEGPMIRPPYRDDTGKPQPGTYEADIPAPQIPERSILALEKITMGRWKNESDRKGAMQWVLSHPALARNAEAYDNVTLREAAIVKYETRWLRAWAETEPRSVALEVVA